MKDDLVGQALYAYRKASGKPPEDAAGYKQHLAGIEAVLAVALEEAAKVAEGQPYKDYHRPDGSPIYRTCPYTTPDGNWATQRHHTNQYGNARADAATAIRALAHAPGQEPAPTCPICAEPFKADDICATDINEGTCHAECLEGSPVVDLDTGEPSDGPVDTFTYGQEGGR